MRRVEKSAVHATGIIPGNRGKVGGSWFRPPLHSLQTGVAGRYHQLLWPESCPDQVDTNQELSGQARSETATEPS
jgi:hypothetical protein